MTFRDASILVIILATVNACIEPYEPPVNDADVRFLVVDAYINASNGTATAQLTRTLPVASAEATPVETNALVSIEEKNGAKYQLTENASGFYQGMVSNLDFNKEYRILIQTSDDKQYMSDFIFLQETPPIDSITYLFVLDGMQLAVNTHDASGHARFFRWRFTETYEYRSRFSSNQMFTPSGTIDYRPSSLQIHTCWKTAPSTTILVGSTERLTESVVSDFPVTFIPKASIKLSRTYSILVEQQTLTREGYNYWSNLQKSTEQLGGLFDPLPSEVSGNIHCTTNPSEKVIGFFSGGMIHDKRIFIKQGELPESMGFYDYRSTNCYSDTILVDQLPNILPNTLLIDAIYQNRALIGYTSSAPACIDCQYMGGVTYPPDFWE
jgi:hypothetical protein